MRSPRGGWHIFVTLNKITAKTEVVTFCRRDAFRLTARQMKNTKMMLLEVAGIGDHW